MYCICTKVPGYTAMHQKDARGHAIPGTFNYELWVCANCMRPSRPVFKGLTDMYAHRRATGLSSASGDAAGRWIITWTTAVSGERVTTMSFKTYPRKMDMDQGRNICLELWQRMDNLIDTIRDPAKQAIGVEGEKFAAMEVAGIIQLVMSPFYADTTTVLQESMARWEARQAGTADTHETPGLAEKIWDPATRFDGTPYSKEAEAAARSRSAAPAKPKVVLDDQKVNFIKHCLANGLQTKEALAGMFGITVEQVEEVNAS